MKQQLNLVILLCINVVLGQRDPHSPFTGKKFYFIFKALYLNLLFCTCPTQISNVFFNIGQWLDLGSGCCAQGTELFGEYLGNLDQCKKKCLEFENDCKYIVHGWITNGQQSTYCAVYNADYPCKQLRNGPSDCGGGGNNGVRSYEFMPGDDFFDFAMCNTFKRKFEIKNATFDNIIV